MVKIKDDMYSLVDVCPDDFRREEGYIPDRADSVIDGEYLPHGEALDPRTVSVDYSKTENVYLDFLDQAVRDATSKRDFKTINTFMLLKSTQDVIRDRIKLDDKKRDMFDSVWREDWPETSSVGKVDLSKLMLRGRASEHGFSLLNTALLEILIARGTIAGQVRFQTSTRLNQKDSNDREVYTYTIYTDPNGEEYVSDAARGVFARIRDLKETGRDYGQRSLLQKDLGITALKDYEVRDTNPDERTSA